VNLLITVIKPLDMLDSGLYNYVENPRKL